GHCKLTVRQDLSGPSILILILLELGVAQPVPTEFHEFHELRINEEQVAVLHIVGPDDRLTLERQVAEPSLSGLRVSEALLWLKQSIVRLVQLQARQPELRFLTATRGTMESVRHVLDRQRLRVRVPVTVERTVNKGPPIRCRGRIDPT